MTTDDTPQLDVDGNPVPTGPGAHLDSNGNVIAVVEQDANAAPAPDGFVDTQGEWLQVQATFMDMSGMPSPRYLAYSHEELKDMVERRNDPGQVGELGSAWHDLGARFVEFDDALWKALLASQQQWTGAAADRARAFTADIGTWFASAGRHAQLAGNRLAGQADVAAWARDAMPAPVESDPVAGLRAAGQQTDPLAFPNALADVESQERASRTAHQRAATIVEQYDQQMAEYGATMPAFSAPPPPPDSAPSSGTGLPATQGNQPSGPGTVPPEHAGPGVNPHETVTPQPSGPTPTPATPVPAPTNPVGPTGPADQTTSQHAISGSQGPGTAGGGSSGGAGGSGGGSPSVAPYAQPNPSARGAMPGTVPGAVGGPPAGVRAGGRGPGGMGGMPSGGRRAGEEDEEHDTAEYLIEPDPDTVFGVHEKTVRPVIGET